MQAMNVRSAICLFAVLISLIGCQTNQNETSFRKIANEIITLAKTAQEQAAANRDAAAIEADGQKITELVHSLPGDVPESLSDAKHALATIGPGFSAVATHLNEEKSHRDAAAAAKSSADEKKGDEVAKEFEATAEAELQLAERERKMADRMIDQLPKQIHTAERLLSPEK